MSAVQDNKELVDFRDRCHMIIEAVEDECKAEGNAQEMSQLYVLLKSFFKDQHGFGALKELLESMENCEWDGPLVEVEEEDRCLCDDHCDESKRIYQCPVHPKYEA